MTIGLTLPRLFANDAVEVGRVDEHIQRIAATVNGGLTGENLDPAARLANSAFLEPNSLLALRAVNSGVRAGLVDCYAGVLVGQNYILKAVSYRINTGTAVGFASFTIRVTTNGTIRYEFTTPVLTAEARTWSPTQTMVSGVVYPEYSAAFAASSVLGAYVNTADHWSVTMFLAAAHV